MDKINLERWDNYFGKTSHEILYASDRYTESSFSFAEKGLPAGTIRNLATPGLMLTELNIKSSDPFQFVDTESGEAAESLFVLKGNVQSTFWSYQNPLQFAGNNQSIQYNPDFSGTHLVRSREFHAFTISYDLDYIGQLLLSGESGELENMANKVRTRQPFLSMPYAMDISGRILEVVHAIQHCPFSSITRYVFLESKLMELFVLQLEQLQSLHRQKANGKWNRQDVERLHAVKEFIDSAYLDSFTLKDLTTRFGLNEFKLKKGYRQLFNTTVFGYVHQLRMQEAKNLLQQKEMNVSEVAFHIGYDNVSSFSTGFKKRFGYTPSMAC